MKYTITINQVGIAEAGLLDKTDLIDWAIIDYLKDWYFSPKKRIYRTEDGSDYVWVNYSHLIKNLPMIHITDKNNICDRFTKLRKLGLIKTIQLKDNSLYFVLTDLCVGTCFRQKNHHEETTKPNDKDNDNEEETREMKSISPVGEPIGDSTDREEAVGANADRYRRQRRQGIGDSADSTNSNKSISNKINSNQNICASQSQTLNLNSKINSRLEEYRTRVFGSRMKSISSDSGNRNKKESDKRKEPGADLVAIRETYVKAWDDAFPGVKCLNWGGKEYKQAKLLLQKVGGLAKTCDLIRYIFDNWNFGLRDKWKVDGAPDIGLILSRGAGLVVNLGDDKEIDVKIHYI